MSNDGFLNIGLPNTHAADAIFWDTIRINQSCMYGKSTGRSGQVAAVTTPVNEGFIDRHLAVEIICIVIGLDRKSTRLNSSHVRISYAVFCLKKKKKKKPNKTTKKQYQYKK